MSSLVLRRECLANQCSQFTSVMSLLQVGAPCDGLELDLWCAVNGTDIQFVENSKNPCFFIFDGSTGSDGLVDHANSLSHDVS